MNFQSWSITFRDSEEVGDLQPPFSDLARNSKIYTNLDDEPLSIAEIETMDFTKKVEASLFKRLVKHAKNFVANKFICIGNGRNHCYADNRLCFESSF